MPYTDLTYRDRQEVNDFRRFLQAIGGNSDEDMSNLVRNHPRGYAWRWYILGQAGAPPEMWEGDDN